MRRALPFLILLLFASPAQAQSPDRTDRESAEAALADVERLLDGRGVEDKRGLTTAIVELVRAKADLPSADRRRANRILARPTDGTGPGVWTAPVGNQRVMCTAHFCLHWVTTTSDAPPVTDSDADTVPDYVEFMAGAFEQSYATEVGTLRWVPPLSDFSRGGSSLVDVYISDIGDDAYGFAVPESTARSAPSYLVLDNDYSDAQFPRYDGAYAVPVQATAAHEFNHTLQFVYDNYQDTWMLESTATWAEEKVFDDANDYRFYLSSWAIEPDEPLTSPGDGELPSSDDLKMYGSAIWNHWLENRYAAQVVRQAWAVSRANSVSGGGFAPGAYDKAIQDTCGPGFAFEFMDFTASVAEWDAPNSGIREGPTFPADVEREGTIAIDATVTGALDHTAFRLYGITPPSAAKLYLTGGLPAGTRGSIALVGHTPAGITKALGILDADGQVTVSLDDPEQYDRITAVVVNADTSHDDFDVDVGDWDWTKDAQAFVLTATTATPPEPAAGPLPTFTPCPPAEPEPEPTPTPTPTPTASPTATPTVTPPPPPPPATSVRLTRNTTRIASAARKGVLSLFARTNKAGRLTARATVDTVTAKRLKVGRRTTTAGTGRRTATAPARVKINVKLTRKVRAALRRQTTRTLRIKVQVTFVPSDGTRAVRRTLSILLRP